MSPHRPTIRAVVACGQRKLDHPAPAGQLYTGPYHRSMISAARRVFADFNIAILSARYGLVALDEVLEPYDTRWADPDAIDPDILALQAVRGWSWRLPVLVMGGRDYVERLRPICTPVQAFTGGLGQQRAQAAAFDIRQAVATLRPFTPTIGVTP